MPRKNTQPRTPVTAATTSKPSETTWVERYSPIFTSPAAGVELAENKLANRLVFSFSQDPGEEVKNKLKHYGYHYDTLQKEWTVNATSMTREIARRLADEFAAGKGNDIAR